MIEAAKGAGVARQEATTPRPCTRCRECPRLPGQRWCRACLTEAQRNRRARVRATGQSVEITEPATAQRSVDPAREPVTHLDTWQSGELQGAVTHPVSASPAADALERYSRAKAELDRVSRETDWRRSRYTPGQILTPLAEAVTQAEAECRRLGVPDDVLKHP